MWRVYDVWDSHYNKAYKHMANDEATEHLIRQVMAIANRDRRIEMDFSNIPENVMSEARNCKSPEELFDLAKREGIELTDEQLEGVAGGQDWCGPYGCTSVKL